MALTDILNNQIKDFIKDCVMTTIWPQKIVQDGDIKRQVCDDQPHTADEITDYVDQIDFTGLAELDNITYAMDSWFDDDDDKKIDQEFTDAYPELAKGLRDGEDFADDLYDQIMDEDGWEMESMDIVRNLENDLENNQLLGTKVPSL